MKHTCPHCNKKTIGNWAKFNSSSLRPAICPDCHGPSQLHYSGTLLEAIATTIGVPAILLWALYVKSWWPVVFLIFILIAGGIVKFVYVPMISVNLEKAKNRQWFLLGGLMVLFVWLMYEAIGK